MCGDESHSLSGNPSVKNSEEITEAGSTYRLTFTYAHNPRISHSPRVYRAFVMVVSGGNIAGSATIAHNTSTMGDMDYQDFSMDFVATDEETDVSLISIGSVGNAGIVIDNVRVVRVGP